MNKKSFFVLLSALVLMIGVHLWKETKLADANDYFLLTDDQKENVNIIFYKNGCPYCAAAKETLKHASLQSEVPTFFIDIETEEGEELQELFGVKYAATLISVRNGARRELIYAEKKNNQYVPKTNEIQKFLA